MEEDSTRAAGEALKQDVTRFEVQSLARGPSCTLSADLPLITCYSQTFFRADDARLATKHCSCNYSKAGTW